MRLHRALPAAGLLLASLAPAPVHAAGRPTEWSLPSGLTVLHQPDARFPIVRVLVTVGAGTADTAPGQRPLAHLAEHLAFRAPLAGGSAFQTLRAAGCEINGVTDLDTTTFEAACPTDAAPLAVAFAAALATHDFAVTDADVEAEARIVLAETTRRLDAGAQTADQAVAGLFTEGHPYNLVERVPDDLLALRNADVERFFDAHYVPSKVVIAVQGDMDAPTLAGALAKVAADGFAHPRQRRGDIAEWPPGAIQIQWLSPTRATWFRDPDNATRPLDPGRPAVISLPSPPVPTPDTTVRTTRHSGTWPQVRVAWHLPPARQDNWFHLQEAEVYAEDTLARVFDTTGVVSGGCYSVLGTRGSALVCVAELESEELQETIGERIARAFEREPSYSVEKRQRKINGSDGRSWQAILERDLLGVAELAELSVYRLATGRFDISSARASALGGTNGFAGWRALRDGSLRPESAVVTYLSPEPRDALAADGEALGGVPTQLVQWPAPALGAAGADEAREEVLENGLRTIKIPVPGAEATAWRLSVPSLPGLEHLDPVIDTALKTPTRFEGNRIVYRWGTQLVEGGTVQLVNQQGLWEPRPLLRALWATVQARRIGDVKAVFRRYVARYVYAGRSPYTWRWRAWRRATRENPERDGIPEVDEAIRTPGAVEAYLEARYQPERATLVLVGRQPPEAEAQIVEELGDWRATVDMPSLELAAARRRPPTPEIVVLDANSRGRTVSVAWACPVGSGKPLDPYTTALVSTLASDRLFDVLRASSGLTYSPSAFTDRRWGGVDLVLEASTELGQEGRVLDALRGIARDLASGGSAPLLTAARRRVLAQDLHDGSSLFGLAYVVPRGLLHAASLEELHARRTALATVNAQAVDALFRGCDTVGAALLVGPADELERNLSDGALPVRVFDWRAEQLAVVKRWAPAMYSREEKWLRSARGDR